MLYVCNDFPYPPRHGTHVDMWNRIQALRRLGVELDIVATNRPEPSDEDRNWVETSVHRLILCPRKRGWMGIFSIQPSQTAIRSGLRHIELKDSYDIMLMQSEFCSEILRNPTLKCGLKMVRVDNDEYNFVRESIRTAKSWLWKGYFLLDFLRIPRHTKRTYAAIDVLGFISHDERERYERNRDRSRQQLTTFLPTAVNLDYLQQPSLTGQRVLFVGNLWAPFNLEAIEWYVNKVHPLLCDMKDYSLTIGGSTKGKGSPWLERLCAPFANIALCFDPSDLTPLFQSSAVFVNPMRRGAGVKVKTVEAAVRGLPIVSTTIGSEGSGLINGVHFRCAEDAAAYADAVRGFLNDKAMARNYVSRAQAFVRDQYDQTKVLEQLLRDVIALHASPVAVT